MINNHADILSEVIVFREERCYNSRSLMREIP